MEQILSMGESFQSTDVRGHLRQSCLIRGRSAGSVQHGTVIFRTGTCTSVNTMLGFSSQSQPSSWAF